MSDTSRWYLPDHGIPGDGVTDVTAALQVLVNTIPTYGQTLDAGAGRYVLSAPIDLKRLTSVNLVGGGIILGSRDPKSGCLFTGSVSGPLFSSLPTEMNGSFTFRDVSFHNTRAGGLCLDLIGFTNGIIDHCQFMGDIGVRAEQSFTFTIKDSKFLGSTLIFPNCVGIITTTCTTILNCDVNGWGVGARLNGTQGNVIGGRWEVNGIAIQAGAKPNGTPDYLDRSVFHGASFEANGVGIQVENAGHLHMAGIAMQGSTNNPLKQSRIGIWLKKCNGITLSSVDAHSRYLESAIRVDNARNVIWDNVIALNAETGKKVWDFRGGLAGHVFRGSNFTIRDDGQVQTRRSIEQRNTLQALAAVDYLNPDVEGRNLRGKGVAVTAGVSSFMVPFTPKIDSWPASLKTATAAGGGSLPAGTYYYVATAVTQGGEVYPSGEKSVVLNGTTTNAVNFTFGPLPAGGFKRRVYRGKSPGVYDGYFELPLDSSAPFADLGQVFSGLRQPPIVLVNDTGMVEPDANYAVVVTPSWPTTVGVSSKSTTGFMVEFGTPAPTGAKLDWVLVR